jgi:hypothetical protein
MTFQDLLNRLRRIWLWSAAISIGFFILPILWITLSPCFVRVGGMHRVGEHPFDPFKFGLWLLQVGMYCCLASAVLALAAGVTCLIGHFLERRTWLG